MQPHHTLETSSAMPFTGRARTRGLVGALLTVSIGAGCTPQSAVTPEPSEAEGAEAPAGAGDSASQAPAFADSPVTLGGRLFDHWAKELEADFVPDDPETEALDGKGGPFGNGTLADREGHPIANTGHGYRLKNLFGWDLRGADGIYGPAFKNKSHVLLPNVLTNQDGRDVWIARLKNGEDAIPAFGSVLDDTQIAAVVDFMLAVRDAQAPRPDDVFTLTRRDAGLYTLAEGGDAERGHALFAQTCAHCHGADGAKWLFDDGEHSLGTLARTSAYETWLKVMNGQPGSPMGPQLDPNADHTSRVSDLRDLHAALCDRTKYPRAGASHEDVPDGDPRCGDALR